MIYRKLILILLISVYSWSCSAVSKEEQWLDDFLVIMKIDDKSQRFTNLVSLYEESDEYVQFIMANELMRHSFFLKKYSAAKKYADNLENILGKYVDSWNYGNAWHDLYMMKGLLLLQVGNVESAKDMLVKSAKTTGSPQLNTYGPDMYLADALLNIGEKDAVLRYLELVGEFWKLDKGRTNSWIASIKGGGKPYFGMNLIEFD